MDPSPGREELLLLSRQPRAWKSRPFPAAALSSTTRWGRGPRWPPRALDWGRRGLCSPRGVAWSGTSPRAQGWGHEATAEPRWGRLPCAGAVSARGRRRLAHDCDFAASLMHRLRGSRLLSLPAAPPWPAACLLTPARGARSAVHSAAHGHTYALAWPHPRDAHLPAGSRTQDWSRPHAASRAGWAARSLLRLRTHRGSCVLFHTRTHTRIPTDSITLLSSLPRTWLATLHLAQASAGQRPSPGAARGQTQQVPAAL